MTVSALWLWRRREDRGSAELASGRPLMLSGLIAAVAAAAVGLAVLTVLCVAGWIAAPHARTGLTGAVRTAAALWLVAHHVQITVRGAGRIGMLPLGLVLLPGLLVYRAARWAVRSRQAGGIVPALLSTLAIAARMP